MRDYFEAFKWSGIVGAGLALGWTVVHEGRNLVRSAVSPTQQTPDES